MSRCFRVETGLEDQTIKTLEYGWEWVRQSRAGQGKAGEIGPEKPGSQVLDARGHRDAVLSVAHPGPPLCGPPRRGDAVRHERAREATRGCGYIDTHSHTLHRDG